jgi:hypothetical protein
VLLFIYHYAECRYAECHYAVSRYAECRGAASVTKQKSVLKHRNHIKMLYDKPFDSNLKQSGFADWANCDFKPVITPNGLCYSFNSLPIDEIFKPGFNIIKLFVFLLLMRPNN